MDRKPAIIFDLDGTLIDSIHDVTAALNRLMAEIGRRALEVEEVKLLVGEGAVVLVEGAFAVTGGAAEDIGAMVDRYRRHYAAHPADRTIVFPGAVAAIERLAAAGHILGICTNKPDELTGLVLDALGLARHFAAILGGDYPRRKPDGEHIRETLRRAGAEGRRAVMIGDSVTDIAAARDAGIPVILVGFGYGGDALEGLGADRVISGFDGLDDAITALLPDNG